MFRKKQKVCPGKLILFFSTTTFFLLKISINKTEVRCQPLFVSSFRKCNWIVKQYFGLVLIRGWLLQTLVQDKR